VTSPSRAGVTWIGVAIGTDAEEMLSQLDQGATAATMATRAKRARARIEAALDAKIPSSTPAEAEPN
jgi:hypothetical protein